MEVLCGIAGKVPVFGMLTDEGRKAKWHIDVKRSMDTAKVDEAGGPDSIPGVAEHHLALDTLD